MDDNNDIIELLRTFAQRHDLDRVIDAEQALLPLGEDAIPALTEALNDPDDEVRLLALEILGHMNENTEPALPAMIIALQDPHRIVRICALEPVASFGERALDAVPILEKWIGIDDEFSHVSAAGHILMIDPSKVDELIPVLVEALESNDFVIQRQAAWLLGQLGELAEDTVPALKRMLDEDDSFIRSVVREAMLEIMGNATDAVT